MEFDEDLLQKIPKEIVANIKLYRLGVFKNSSFELVQLKKETDYPPHHHEGSDARFYFILGKGKIILDDQEFEYNRNSSFEVPRGIKHGFKPIEDSLFLSIQTPPIKNPETGEEDIHF